MPLKPSLTKTHIISFLSANWPPICLALLSAIVSFTFARIELIPDHDIALWKPALDISEGKMIFRDSFCHYGGLTVLIQALFIKLFGNYLLVVKASTVLFQAMIVIVQWLVFVRFLPRAVVTFTCLIWIFLHYYFVHPFLPWAPAYAVFFQMLSLYFLIRYFEQNKEWFIFGGGACLALSFYCKQPYGVIFLLAQSAFFVALGFKNQIVSQTEENKINDTSDASVTSMDPAREEAEEGSNNSFAKYLLDRWKPVVRHIFILWAGFLFVVLSFTSWLAFNGALEQWWIQSIVYAYNHVDVAEVGHGLKAVVFCLFYPAADKEWPNDLLTGDLIYLVFPIVCFMVLAEYLQKLFQPSAWTKKEIIVLTVLAASFASWFQYYPNCGIGHRYWSSTPSLGIFLFYLWSLVNRILGSKKIEMRIAVMFLLVLFFLHKAAIVRIQGGWKRIEKANREYVQLNVPKELSGIKLPAQQAYYYQAIGIELNKYFQNHPNPVIISAIFEGAHVLSLAFIKNVRNFHPMWMPAEAMIKKIYPDFYQQRWQYIVEKRPFIITWPKDKTTLAPLGYQMVIEVGSYAVFAPPGADSNVSGQP